MNAIIKQLIVKVGHLSLGVFIFIISLYSQVQALPQMSEVVSGDASFSYSDNTLQIDASDKAIINYQSFDIESSESVIINMPGSEAEILNRVTGGSLTRIMGSLRSNGILFLP